MGHKGKYMARPEETTMEFRQWQGVPSCFSPVLEGPDLGTFTFAAAQHRRECVLLCPKSWRRDRYA